MRRSTLFILVPILLAACSEFWGKLDNPVDPGSPDSYQGYETIKDPDAIAPAYPLDGETLVGVRITLTKILGASAYAIRLAVEAAALPSGPYVFEKADYDSNILDLSAAALVHGTTYYWQTRARKADGATWGAWSAAAHFTTDFSTPAATPRFSPAGGTFASDQSVAISCATAGATIRFTMNGDSPTTDSAVYSGAINVAGHGTAMTIKAIATAPGYASSATGNATYAISYPATATPTFDPPGGTYASDQSVTIACATTEATIFYTTDGTDPASPGTRQSGASPIGPIAATVFPATTIRAVATAPNFALSAGGSARYGTLVEMVAVSGGTFNQGREVTLSDFAIGKYEVTFDQYDEFCAATDRSLLDDNDWGRGAQPAILVSWYDTLAFCNWLSEREGLQAAYSGSGTDWTLDRTKSGYRLPTEAEWEYAARGGALTHGYDYAGSDDIDAVAWHYWNSGTRVHPVGGKAPNELGLYDMIGNVIEWCWDWGASYPSQAETDPVGPATGTYRVNRGGSAFNDTNNCSLTSRSYGDPMIGSSHILGFRVARTK